MFAFAVVGHPGTFNLAGVFRLQVAELSADTRTAAADNAGGDGGIVIGREVQIIGQIQLEAV